MRRWWPVYAGCVVAFLVVIRWRLLNAPTVTGSAAYFAGCVVQQLVFQHLICRPMSEEFGPGAKAQWGSGLLFSLVHVPNWVLVPATFLWGAAAWGLYRRDRSLWAVAILQYLLSGILYGVVPYQWHHAFRVGPRYWGAGF